MSEWAEWLEFCEVSGNSISNRCWKFQLSILKNKKVLFLKKYIFLAVVFKYAKRDPKDGICCLNFQWRFWPLLRLLIKVFLPHDRIEKLHKIWSLIEILKEITDASADWFNKITTKPIRMSHWRHTMVDGAEFWTSFQRPKVLKKCSRW